MKMRKWMALALAGVMTVGLAACGGSTTDTGSDAGSDAEESTTQAESDAGASDASYTVGVVQLVQHPALDAATEGFEAALTEELGDAVTVDVQNAAGDSAQCATIANGFVSSGYDLIMANATPALQAAQAATADIPIVGTSVTDYATALQIDNWTGTTGANISGTSDLAPLEEQAQLLKELFPNAKTVGMIYCSAEANSVYQIQVMEEALKKLGYTCQEYAFADSNDIASVCTNAVANVDVLYIPTDNAAAAASACTA